MRVDVAHVPHVPRHAFRLPTIAADQEAALGQGFSSREEELLDPRFSVGEPVTKERQVGRETRVWLDRMVGRWVERIVHGDAAGRAEALIGVDDRWSAAVGQDIVERRKRTADRVIFVTGHFIERGCRIDIPEDAQRVVAAVLDDAGNQLSVENADAARLDDDVRCPRLGEHGRHALGRRGINNGARPVWRIQVAMALPLVGVGLV